MRSERAGVTRSQALPGNAIPRGSAARTAKWRWSGLTFLLGTGLIVAAVWTIVLPRIGDRPSVRASIDRRESLGVNANAMFYTELEAMETLRVEWNSE